MQNAVVDRGSVDVDLSDSGSDSVSNSDNTNNDDLASSNRKKEILSDEALFKKLKNSITARSNLPSIHSTRAHIWACSIWSKKIV